MLCFKSTLPTLHINSLPSYVSAYLFVRKNCIHIFFLIQKNYSVGNIDMIKLRNIYIHTHIPIYI